MGLAPRGGFSGGTEAGAHGARGRATVPNSVFHNLPTADRTHVRFAFCKRPDVLAEAADSLRMAFNG